MTDDFSGKLIADKYRILSLLREEGAGDLYLGRHEFMDKPVTIKILPQALAIDARWSKRFLDEAKSASSVSHPNVLNVTDFGTDSKGVVYTVFEPSEDQTLRSVVEGKGSLDVATTLDIAKQSAAGIAAAHAKNVIHGQLTPEDIFLFAKGHESQSVKVYGFGADPMSVPRDADPRYLSPEQCTDFPVADQRSDIYSLGVIIYEMLAGVAPFEGKTVAEVKLKREAEPPPPLSAFRRDLPPDLEPMILSALAGDPERRYPTMAAFAEDIDLLSGGVAAPVAAAAASTPPKKNIWQTAFIVLAGISLLAVALIYATSVKKTDPTTQLQADARSLPVQPIGPATGAQEENLAKLPEMTDAEITAAATGTMEAPPGTLPGGDGYNAWSNGGAPPIGAPPPQYVPPGQTVTVDPNGGSQFMPSEIPPGCSMLPSGLVLCPKPIGSDGPAKPTPTPKNSNANAAVQPTPVPVATPKPMATPPTKNNKPGTNPPGKDKPAPATKPAASGKPKISE